MRPAVRCETLAISLLICFGFLAGPARADEPAAGKAGASTRLKYLPKEYWAVVECDVSTVMKFMNSDGARQNPQYAQFKQYLQFAKAFSGVDLETEVDWVTLFASGTPGDKTTALLVAQGSFKNDVVEKRLVANLGNSVTEKTYKKNTIYAFGDSALCFPEPSTIVVGEEALVREAIDNLGDAARALPQALKKVLDRTPTKSFVWAALQPSTLLEHKELADWREGNGELYRELKKIEGLSLSFDLAEDGLLIKALGYVSAPDGAKDLHQYLSDRKKALLHKDGVNVLFTSLLIFADVNSNGPFVEGSLRLTGQALKELWETKVIIRP
jgi:hypothetical protein